MSFSDTPTQYQPPKHIWKGHSPILDADLSIWAVEESPEYCTFAVTLTIVPIEGFNEDFTLTLRTSAVHKAIEDGAFIDLIESYYLEAVQREKQAGENCHETIQ